MFDVVERKKSEKIIFALNHFFASLTANGFRERTLWSSYQAGIVCVKKKVYYATRVMIKQQRQFRYRCAAIYDLLLLMCFWDMRRLVMA